MLSAVLANHLVPRPKQLKETRSVRQPNPASLSPIMLELAHPANPLPTLDLTLIAPNLFTRFDPFVVESHPVKVVEPCPQGRYQLLS